MKSSPISLTPDWENPKGIALVWPETFYDDLIDFYIHFSDIIPKNFLLTILVKDENSKNTLLNKILNCKKYVIIPELSDIWIKDFPLLIRNKHHHTGL